MWCLAIDNHDAIGGAKVLSRGIVGDINGLCLEADSVQVSVYQTPLEDDAAIVMLQKIVQDHA
jgi:hypothetical protein